MKINSMTTISKSITLKILRATNQICQLKSNSGCIYKQTAVVSVTQHEGLMGPSTCTFSSLNSHSNGIAWQLLTASNRVKGTTWLPPPQVWPGPLGPGHVLSPKTGSPLFATHAHPNFSWCWQPGPAPQLTQPQSFTGVFLLYLENLKVFFSCASVINTAPL